MLVVGLVVTGGGLSDGNGGCGGGYDGCGN